MRSTLSPRTLVLALAVGATSAVIVGVLGGAVAESLPGEAGQSAASASRMLAVIAGIASAAAYLLASAGRRKLGLALASGAALMVAAWLALVGSRAPSRAPRVLLESDRTGLEEVTIDGRRWVAHRTLGFRLPQPSIALAPADDMVRETEARAGAGWRDAHQLWAFESEDRSITVTLDLTRAPSVDADALRARAEAASAPLRAQGIEVDAEPPRVVGQDCATAAFSAPLAHGGRVEGRALAFRDPRSHRAFHLVATIVAPEGVEAREYLDAVVVPCGP